MCSFEGIYLLARWLSWLERRPVTAEVVGSIPIRVARLCLNQSFGIIAQLGEHLPYKQRVIGSSPIGPIQYGEIAQLARAHGSYPWCRGFESPSRYLYGILAQLGEHLPYKQRVTGSSPVGPIVTNVLCRCGSIGRAADL